MSNCDRLTDDAQFVDCLSLAPFDAWTARDAIRLLTIAVRATHVAAAPEGEPSNAERDRHIEGFRDLNANWDSYGAEKLPEETIQLALRVSKTLTGEWKAIPCADGPSVWFYRGDEDEIIQVWASV